MSASSFASAQGVWTHDFTVSTYGNSASQYSPAIPFQINSTMAPADHAAKHSGHGMEHAGDLDARAAILFSEPGANGAFNIVNTASTYTFNPGVATTTMKMGWSPKPGGGIGNGTSAGNQLFQMGFVNSLNGLMGVNGKSIYLSGLEISANGTTDVTNLKLNVADTTGVLGSFNGGSTVSFNAADYHIFEFGITPTPTGQLNVSLNMRTMQAVGSTDVYNQVQFTNFGSLTVANNLQSKSDVYSPALGFNLADSTQVSYSGANFDTVPEPSSALLLLSSSFLLALRRRR